jgi:hypothetical protein
MNPENHTASALLFIELPWLRVFGQNEGGSEGKLTLFCRFKDTPKYRQWGFAGNYARLSRVSPRTKKHSRDKTTAIDVSMKTSWLL